MMLRKILKAKGLENTYTYSIIERSFAASFIFLRSFVATWVVYNIWVSNLLFITKIAISITYGVGLFWIFVIISIAIKQVDKENTSVIIASLNEAIGFINKNQVLFSIAIVVWGFILPFYLTSVVNTGFVNLVVNGFIVI